MKVLVIKTSSLGDVIHTLPALTDAAEAIPEIRFDWVVEEAFAEVPAWHPAVDRVIPVAIRRWRKNLWKTWRSGEWKQCKQHLSAEQYDAVIDAQGLLKSAWLIRHTRYKADACFGLDKASAREPGAARFYKRPLAVAKGQHAVARTRQLFASALGYSLPAQKGKYGLVFDVEHDNTVVLLHGTTWESKLWPEIYWQQIATRLHESGYRVLVPWGNESEQQRAKRLASASHAEVLPRMSLTELARTLASAAGCVSVDTGLGHLAAAVGTPTVSMFGPTDAGLTGFYGENQKALQADFHCSPCMLRECTYADDPAYSVVPPCFESLPSEAVYEQLQKLVAGGHAS